MDFEKLKNICNEKGIDLREVLHESINNAVLKQLKAEAKFRFGNIKSGEAFNRSWITPPFDNVKIGDVKIGIGYGYFYKRNSDQLYFDSILIYKQGKWATKLPERKKVKFSGFDYEGETGPDPRISFEFYAVPIGDLKKAGEYLAKQLEEYLNNQS